MLSTEQMQQLRQRLADERARLHLTEGTNTDELSTDEEIGVGNHMAEDATAVFNQEANLSLRLNQEHSLQQVELAMQRMDSGHYGLCERCGREIDFARLEANPAARYDLECQQLVESQA